MANPTLAFVEISKSKWVKINYNSSIGSLYVFRLLNNARHFCSAVCSDFAASAPQLAAVPTAKVSPASPIYP